MSRPYTSTREDAAAILRDCVLDGESTGWHGGLDQLATLLAPYGVKYVDDMAGTWRWVAGHGPQPHFLEELCAALGWQGGTIHAALREVRELHEFRAQHMASGTHAERAEVLVDALEAIFGEAGDAAIRKVAVKTIANVLSDAHENAVSAARKGDG